MKHVVSFSGGLGSWAAAKRVAAQHGTDDLILLFADTLIEDKGLYEFLYLAAENVGGKLEVIMDGRNPWDVFEDVRFLGNSHVDPCSRILKRELLTKWIQDRWGPKEVTVYVGIDWSEEHRLITLRKRYELYVYEAPLCDPPYLSKMTIQTMVKEAGLPIPRLYTMGFPHNNCGGFCIKAGHAHFKLLLERLPDRYAYHEAQEERMIQLLGKKVSILNCRKGGGKRKPLTLKEFRERIEAGDEDGIDLLEWGGCGCAV